MRQYDFSRVKLEKQEGDFKPNDCVSVMFFKKLGFLSIMNGDVCHGYFYTDFDEVSDDVIHEIDTIEILKGVRAMCDIAIRDAEKKFAKGDWIPGQLYGD